METTGIRMQTPRHIPRRNVLLRSPVSAMAIMAVVMLLISPRALAQDGIESEFSFVFESDAEGWAVGFADLPVDHDQSIFELDHGHRPLPDGLEGSGVYVQGHNRSDDLFMFLKRGVDGLRPEAGYAVSVSIDLATNVPTGSFGIGGSPGESVFVKAGASTVEPVAGEGDNRHLRMNIDKGNQSQGGESMVVIGDVAHAEVVDGEYRIKTLDNMGLPLVVDTDTQGGVWLIVGTDSGFEGLSAFYYSRISYTLSPLETQDGAGEPPEDSPEPPDTAVEPPDATEPPDTGAEPPDATEPPDSAVESPGDAPEPPGEEAPSDGGGAASAGWPVALVAGLGAAVAVVGLVLLKRSAPRRR